MIEEDDDNDSLLSFSSSSSSCSRDSSTTDASCCSSSTSSCNDDVRSYHDIGKCVYRFCNNAIQLNNPNQIVLHRMQGHQDDGNNREDSYAIIAQLGTLISHNDVRIDEIQFCVNALVQIITTCNVCLNRNYSIDGAYNRLMDPFYKFISAHPTLSKICIKNGSIMNHKESQTIVNDMFYAIANNRSIRSLRLECIDSIPVASLIRLLQSTRSKLQNLEIDSCAIVLSYDGYSNNLPLQYHDDDGLDRFSLSEQQWIEQLAIAFSSNTNLRRILMYRMDEMYVNDILIHMRSHPKLHTLALSMPGNSAVMGIESTIHQTPSMRWSNAIGNILLPSCNSQLRVLKFHSIQFDEITLRTLCDGICQNLTVTILYFEYCRYVVDGNNYDTIKQHFLSIFVVPDSNDCVSDNKDKAIIYHNCSSSSSLSSSCKSPMELTIRQTSYYTNGNPILTSLPVMLSNRQCILLQKLTITSLAEKDFVALMNNMITNTTLSSLTYEYNDVERESATDAIRCHALIRTVPKLKYLIRLKIGLGVGIDSVSSQRLLQAFQQNTSLQHIRITYLGARQFYIDPKSHSQLQCYQDRNKFLPILLRNVSRINYTTNSRRNSNDFRRRHCHRVGENMDINNVGQIQLGLVSRMLHCTLEWDDGISIIFRTLLTLN